VKKSYTQSDYKNADYMWIYEHRINYVLGCEINMIYDTYLYIQIKTHINMLNTIHNKNIVSGSTRNPTTAAISV